MTNERRQEIIRRQAGGMRAMSNEEMSKRQREAAQGAYQRGPLTTGEQEAMRNFWGGPANEQNNFVPNTPTPTLWVRFKRWIQA